MSKSDVYTLAECVQDYIEARDCADDFGALRIAYVNRMRKCRTYVRMLRALVEYWAATPHVAPEFLKAMFGPEPPLWNDQLSAAEALMGIER